MGSSQCKKKEAIFKASNLKYLIRKFEKQNVALLVEHDRAHKYSDRRSIMMAFGKLFNED